jgi:S1-C subfamily serine protease
MSFDDELDDELASGPPPPAADRLWRHPSELFHAPPRISSVALVAALAGAVLGTGITIALVGERDDRPAVQVIQSSLRPPGAGAPEEAVAEIAERVHPAIVHLRMERGEDDAWASGVLFRDDGHIITSEHRVAGHDSVSVLLSDGKEVPGRLVGADADTDVAVVKIDGGPYATAPLGIATPLRIGTPVVAIGTEPTGTVTVSAGVVSALGRSIERPGKIALLDMIQTDARMAPGGAGGALVDLTGGVVGLTAAGAAPASQGMLGYATRIFIVRTTADEIIRAGRVAHPWIGIEGADLGAEDAQRMGVPGGVSVKRVIPRGPAEIAGLAEGDVLLTVNDDAVQSMTGLLLLLRSHRTDEEVRVSYLRKGRRMQRTVTLVDRPAS